MGQGTAHSTEAATGSVHAGSLELSAVACPICLYLQDSCGWGPRLQAEASTVERTGIGDLITLGTFWPCYSQASSAGGASGVLLPFCFKEKQQKEPLLSVSNRY